MDSIFQQGNDLLFQYSLFDLFQIQLCPCGFPSLPILMVERTKCYDINTRLFANYMNEQINVYITRDSCCSSQKVQTNERFSRRNLAYRIWILFSFFGKTPLTSTVTVTCVCQSSKAEETPVYFNENCQCKCIGQHVWKKTCYKNCSPGPIESALYCNCSVQFTGTSRKPNSVA